MPQQNGRIYRDPNATPNALGISLDDIGLCIGLGSRELGTLCQGMDDYETEKVDGVSTNPYYCDSNQYHGSIKAWSKAKPVFFTGPQSYLGPDATPEQIALRQKGMPISYRKTPTLGDEAEPLDNPYIINEPLGSVYGIEVPKADKMYANNMSTGAGDWTADSEQVNTYVDGATGAVSVLEGFLGGLLMDGLNIAASGSGAGTPVVTLRWRYNPPLSSPTLVPFRVLDYNNYNKNCRCPFPEVIDGVVIGVTKTTGANPSINFTINANLPVVPEGNITFDQIDAAIKADEIGTNKKVLGGLGLQDLYLCALVEHIQESIQVSNAYIIDQLYYKSSGVVYRNSSGGGWGQINFNINSAINGKTLDQQYDLLTNGEQTDPNDPNGRKMWRVKLFWSSVEINVVNKDMKPSAVPNLILVRGDDTSPSGSLVHFLGSSNMAPQVVSYNVERIDDGASYELNFTFVLQNSTNSEITFAAGDIWLARYDGEGYDDHVANESQIVLHANSSMTFSYPSTWGALTENFDYVFYAKSSNSNYEACGVLIRQLSAGGNLVFGGMELFHYESDIEDDYPEPPASQS